MHTPPVEENQRNLSVSSASENRRLSALRREFSDLSNSQELPSSGVIFETNDGASVQTGGGGSSTSNFELNVNSYTMSPLNVPNPLSSAAYRRATLDQTPGIIPVPAIRSLTRNTSVSRIKTESSDQKNSNSKSFLEEWVGHSRTATSRYVESLIVCVMTAYISYACWTMAQCYLSIISAIPFIFSLFTMKNSDVSYMFVVSKTLQWLMLGVALALPVPQTPLLPYGGTNMMLTYMCFVWKVLPKLAALIINVAMIVVIGVSYWPAGNDTIALALLFGASWCCLELSDFFGNSSKVQGSENEELGNADYDMSYTSSETSDEPKTPMTHSSWDSGYSLHSARSFSRGQHVILLRTMSDEIRGPSSNLVNLVRMLRQDMSPVLHENPNASFTIDLLEGTANRLLVLLNSYLDLVKLSGDGLSLENQPIDVQHLIRIAISPSLPSTRLRRIPVYLTIDPEMPQSLVGDEVRVSQVCSNLFDHVLSRTTRGHIEVNVGVCDEGTTLQVSVKAFDADFDTTDLQVFTTGFSTVLSMNLRISKTLLTDLFGGKFNFKDTRLTVSSGGCVLLQWEIPLPHKKFTAPGNAELVASPQNIRTQLNDCEHGTIYYDDSLNPIIRDALELYLGKHFQKVTTPSTSTFIVGSKYSESYASTHNPQIIISTDALAERGVSSHTSNVYHLLCPFFPFEIYGIIEVASGKQKSPVAGVANNLGKRGHVLIAEDNVIAAQILSRIVKKAGSECTVTENGLRCVEAFQEDPLKYDVVLMDMCMPVMGGIEATKRIRCLEAEMALHNPIRIYAVTANALAADEDQCFRAGANGYFTKPISRDTVLAILHMSIGTRSNHRASNDKTDLTKK